MTIPSEAKLIEAFGADKGSACYAVLKGRRNPRDYSRTDAWYCACYNPPGVAELKLNACDEILEACGIEGITPDGAVYPTHAYVNMGDTYETTLVHDLDNDRIFIGAWGDVVEAMDSDRDADEA